MRERVVSPTRSRFVMTVVSLAIVSSACSKTLDVSYEPLTAACDRRSARLIAAAVSEEPVEVVDGSDTSWEFPLSNIPVIDVDPLDADATEALALLQEKPRYREGWEWGVITQKPKKLVLLGSPIGTNTSYEAVYFTRADRSNDWTLVRRPGVGCGVGPLGTRVNSRWVLNPENQPEPTSSQLVLLVQGSPCLETRRLDESNTTSVALTNDTSVLIYVFVEPPEQRIADKDFDMCYFENMRSLRIDLGEPLGDRQLMTGIPPRVVHPRPGPTGEL